MTSVYLIKATYDQYVPNKVYVIIVYLIKSTYDKHVHNKDYIWPACP